MHSIGLTFDLKPGCYDEYKKAHDDLWPEIAASMSDNDVSMVIYRFENQLFLCATAPSEADWTKSREHPALAKWSDYMSQLIVSDPDGQIIFHEMEEAFAFGKFRQGL
jgi:L-rhamnose mutarotase